MLSNEELLGNVRLLASDLDGTLLDPDHKPAQGTFEAIAEFQAAGGIFAVCTGRDLGSARGVLKGLDIDNMPGVYLNGTTVKGDGGRRLREQTLPTELLHKMVAWGRSHKDVASILFVDGDTHYVMDKREEWALYMHKHLLDPEPLEVKGGYDSPNPDLPGKVSMMRVICSPDIMNDIKPEVADCVKGLAMYAQSLPTTIDIMAPNTNKATGLQVLLQSLGLDESKVCAIGDSENDLEMLQSVRVACAMGNAVKKTKSVSHFVMPRNSDNPAGVVALLHALTKALKGNQSHIQAPLREPEPALPQLRVACFSAGSWGTGVARLVGQALLRDNSFQEGLTMWILDEEVDGRKLTDVINTDRENPKDLPHHRLPRNLTATSDIVRTAEDADILIFVVPRDELISLSEKLSTANVVKPSATALVMSKEVIGDGKKLRFGSQRVSEKLGIPTAVLMGGTLGVEVAQGHFAEATLGCADADMSKTLISLFSRPNFSVKRLASPQAVELFAVLKSVISLASGFCDGLGLCSNTKAAVVRIGAVELSKFATKFYPEQSSAEALNEACGWTDIIASSFGNSRSRRCAAEFAKDPSQSWDQVATKCLSSGMPTGISVVAEVMTFIAAHLANAEFPFICKIHSIVKGVDMPSTLTEMAVPRVRATEALRVAVLGSGNWGCTVAKILAENTRSKPEFHLVVKIWVHEEMINGRPLTEIMNNDHENPKYLPGVQLPANLVAISDPVEVVQDAAIVIFNLPHQFLPSLMDKITGKMPSTAVGVCMIKGYFEVDQETGSITTGTQIISEKLGIPCYSLNGANVAKDVAEGLFAEATLGCTDEAKALLLTNLFNTPTFSVRSCPDVLGVEMFGGMKNVIALAAGFCDGLGFAANTKAALLRRGLLEMSGLVREVFPSSRPETAVESCGVADLLTTCYSGRNRLCAEAFATAPPEKRSWEAIEAEMLGGQKLQGPSTSIDLQAIIEKRGLATKFPLFTAIHAAVVKAIPPEDVFTCIGFARDGA